LVPQIMYLVLAWLLCKKYQCRQNW